MAKTPKAKISNQERLIKAHVIPGPLAKPYDKLIAELSDAEVRALIRIKKRLDEVNERYGDDDCPNFIGMVVPL
jgi:hypothetical protein